MPNITRTKNLTVQYLKHHILPWVKSNSKAIIRIAWFIGFGLIIGITAYQILKNWNQISSYAWQLKIPNLILGFFIYCISLCLTGSLWALIIKHFTGLTGYWTHIRLYSLTNLAQRLPTLIPYLSARTEAYAALGVSRSVTLTAMSLEVISTIIGMLIVAITTTPFSSYPFVDFKSTWQALLVLIPMIIICLKPRWLLKVINKGLVRLKRNPIQAALSTRDISGWIVLYMLISINGGVLYFILLNSIYSIPNLSLISIINVFVIAGLAGWMGQFLFFMPSLIFRQLVVAYLLSFFVPWPIAIASSILSRLMIQFYELSWVGLFQFLHILTRKIRQ